MNLVVKIENNNGINVVSSRIVAEQLGKEHSDVMRKIKEVLGVGEFSESSYINSQNKVQPELSLTKDGFILLCMNYQGYNEFKRAYINEFNRMESELSIKKDSYMIEDPIERAKAWIQEQEEKKALQIELEVKEQILQEYKPKIDYVDTILKSNDTLTVTQIAADYGISAKRLNQILNEEKIQRKVGGQWLLYSNHMNNGYTKSETYVDTTNTPRLNTKWTQKGRLKIHEVLSKLNIIPNMDKGV